VASIVTTSVVLGAGLHADLRTARRRRIAAVVLITLGPVIAILPVLVVLIARDGWLVDMIGTHFGMLELIAVLVAVGWTVAIATAARVRRPLVSLARFGFGVTLCVVEVFFGLLTALWGEGLAILLLPLILFGVTRYYRDEGR
jgi:hypothetical protein